MLIDLHTHILCQVDDGSDSLEKSLEMLRVSEKSGTDTIVLTPHSTEAGARSRGLPKDELLRRMMALSDASDAAGLHIRFYSGMEIFGCPDIGEKLDRGDFLSLGNSKYLLVEFPFGEEADYFFYVLEQIERRGFTPLIAHPERYRVVQMAPRIVYDWNCRGWPVQVNKGSFAGRFGGSAKHAVETLMDYNLVQAVASDSHDTEYRAPGLGNIYEHISKHYSKGTAEFLLSVNPARVLRKKEMLIINPRIPDAYNMQEAHREYAFSY